MPTTTKTSIFKVDSNDPDSQTIASCARILKRGGLVAFPTETVYGLGADAFNREAMDRIYEVKKRPASKPLTLHIADMNMLRDAGCEMTPEIERLIERFWPGPLTILMKTKDSGKVGFRMPRHNAALSLIRAVGSPVVAPSANMSGRRPPTESADVLEAFDGKIDAILDAGPTDLGVESTIVDATVKPPLVVRKGAISDSEILEAVT